MSVYENQLWELSTLNQSKVLSPNPRNHKMRLDKMHRLLADWEYRVSIARPRCKQLLHMINKFGGILPFSVACNRHPNHIIYKWLGVTSKYRVDDTRWGIIPSMGMTLRLVVAARSFGVVLTPEDLFPDLIDGDYMRNPHSNPELMAWAMAIQPGGGDSRESMQKLETEIAELLEG